MEKIACHVLLELTVMGTNIPPSQDNTFGRLTQNGPLLKNPNTSFVTIGVFGILVEAFQSLVELNYWLVVLTEVYLGFATNFLIFLHQCLETHLPLMTVCAHEDTLEEYVRAAVKATTTILEALAQNARVHFLSS